MLHHEAFGIFKDRCKAAPSERALTFLDEHTAKGFTWYQEEARRRTAILSVFEEHLGVRFHAEKIPYTDFTTDGNLAVTVMLAAIREARNQTGPALNRAIINYSQFLYDIFAHHRFYNFSTAFPCILVVEMGTFAL